MFPSKRRLIVLVASVVAVGLLLGGEERVRATNLKQALLHGPHRPAISANVPSDLPEQRPRLAGPRPLYVPGRIVVKFDPAVSAQSVERMARQVGAVGVRAPSYADFVYVDLPLETDPVTAAAALAGRPGVVYAEPDGTVFTTARPNDPLYRHQWNFQKLDMERAWDVNPGANNNVVVAVLDSGVAYLNEGPFAQAPDLRGTRFVAGYDFIFDDAKPVDLNGHGTHVAGTIAQTTNNNEGVAGMAYNVSLMPVKAVGDEVDEALGAEFPYGISTAARAINFAVERGAKVINMSFRAIVPNTATQEAIRSAVSRGVFIAIAAGNDAQACQGCPPGFPPNPVSYPAKYAEDIDGAMAVAALDYNLRRAPYSSFHTYVEIAAPGGDNSVDLNGDGFVDGVLQQTLDPAFVAAGIYNQFGYFFFPGTSMASPHVAGFAALLISQGVTSPAAVEAAIKQYATDVDPPGRDPQTGFGVLNPRATLLGLGLLR